MVEDYLDWLAHPTLGRVEIQSILDDVEAANAKDNGYGAATLDDVATDCMPGTVNWVEAQQIEQLADAGCVTTSSCCPCCDVLEQLRRPS